ncbi:hypothetical protein SAMN04488062_102272 [Flavobacterium omnivorum]|uniref:VapC45 PIN like domain-containing protein n=1 Tax=Flavobacterium omnivorum TaxID=178355 RepID=A0A1G7XE01_9FLAO|nr:hypothetical protein [Flavobacterium omnivorum]SDG82374.1 hypothetical protein SAMN04488062_102272 [Flavobacterium omnivorum]
MTNIYIDENFSHHLASGLDLFQQHLNSNEKINIQVLSIKKVFGRGAKDEDWIPLVGKEKGIVITQDLRIHTTRHQNELYKKHGLAVFFFKPPSNGYTFWEMVEQLVKRWPEIKKKASDERPFAYRISPKNMERLK